MTSQFNWFNWSQFLNQMLKQLQKTVFSFQIFLMSLILWCYLRLLFLLFTLHVIIFWRLQFPLGLGVALEAGWSWACGYGIYIRFVVHERVNTLKSASAKLLWCSNLKFIYLNPTFQSSTYYIITSLIRYFYNSLHDDIHLVILAGFSMVRVP